MMETEVPRLLLDAMLGKLARWLRLLGYDALYLQDEDALLARRARAEGRLLLTRDRELARRRGLRVLLVEAQELEAQLKEVLPRLPALPPQAPPRCMLCNAPLRPITREEASKLVPPYVAAHHTGFKQCPRCGRVYWRGTHWEGIARLLEEARQERR